MAEYPTIFELQRKRLLEFRPSQAQSRYRDVYATFEASVAILTASGEPAAKDALDLLPVLSICGPNRLPLQLFEAAWKKVKSVEQRFAPHFLPLMQVAAVRWDSFRLVEALNLLKAFTLLSTNVSGNQVSVSMHPLVHAWSRDRQPIKACRNRGSQWAVL
jgi:hypothetical protein